MSEQYNGVRGKKCLFDSKLGEIKIRELETVRSCCIQPIINALMRELTHVVFSLQRCCESPISEHRMKALIKIYMTFPCP
jgi:hypothetical protein